MEKILLSIVSALLGFALSQSFNFVSYLRRPRFKIVHWSDGVLSSYTGDPPETPWEIELGFHLENYGKNPAKDIRIFVSDIKVSEKSDGELELTSIGLLELKRPINFVPSKECVEVRLGVVKSDQCALSLDLHGDLHENAIELVGADTRGKIRFSAKFYVSCEEKNSSKSFILEFRPDKNDWASTLLEDYTEAHLDKVAGQKF